MVGQVGLWSIGLFTPELVRGSLLAQRQSELAGVVTGDKGVNVSMTGLDLERLARPLPLETEAVRRGTAWKRQDDSYVGWGTLLQDVGSFFGAPLCTLLTSAPRAAASLRLGLPDGLRRLVHVRLAVAWPRRLLDASPPGVLYLRDLRRDHSLPARTLSTRLRTTGTGFCYNIARYLTATGLWPWKS